MFIQASNDVQRDVYKVNGPNPVNLRYVFGMPVIVYIANVAIGHDKLIAVDEAFSDAQSLTQWAKFVVKVTRKAQAGR